MGARRAEAALLLAVGMLLAGSLVPPRAVGAPDDEPAIAIRPFGEAPDAVPASTPAASGERNSGPAAVDDADGADPVAIAVDGKAGVLYWAERRTGAIRRATLDGENVETLIDGIDAPVALTLDADDGRVYWATDGEFPRRIQRSRTDGSEAETLVVGEELNRPTALAVDAAARRLYWTESVSGRVRRSDLDGSSIETLHEERIFTAPGLVLQPAAGRMYWADFARAKIQRARTDGTGVEDVLDARHGVDAPSGLAFDPRDERLYWSDRARGVVRSAKVDGSGVRDVVEPAGASDPRGVALDLDHRKLYWADAGLDRIRRTMLDGGPVEDVVSLSTGFEKTIVASSAGAGAGALARCRDALTSAGPVLARDAYRRLAACMDKVAFVKAVKWRAVEPSLAAPTCAATLGAFGADGKLAPARAELVRAVAGPCGPAAGGFSAQDLGALAIDAAATRCAAGAADGGGAAAHTRWLDCVADRYEALAVDAIAARYPRAIEWLDEVRPFVRAGAERITDGGGVAAKTDEKRKAGATAALDAVRALLAARQAAAPADSAPGFPASGLKTRYASDKNDGIDAPVAVPDDATVAAGAPLRFRDNRDGTVTDLNTGLMWEKKCDGCGGLHDSLAGFAWSGGGTQDTIWDWLDRVNAESGAGFAGHTDWRIPNVKELVSIVDYERFNPAVSPELDAARCGLGCDDLSDPECSCSAQGAYWSSTTFSDFPAHALTVTFNLGLVGDDVKTARHFVRAVRLGARTLASESLRGAPTAAGPSAPAPGPTPRP